VSVMAMRRRPTKQAA